MTNNSNKKTNKINWTKAQVIGFWSTVVLLLTFWFGVWVGTEATLNSQRHEASVKASAVEEYKKSLEVKK